MKTKTKILALVEIAVVLCSVFLVAIPAIVADQTMQKVSANTITTASEDDYVLGIYGNANEDDTIDMGDVVYTKLAIFGKKPKTELCDAKYDGRINVLDVIQTKLIILGKEKELTIVDDSGDEVTIHKPVKRILPLSTKAAEVLQILDEMDKVVGVTGTIAADNIFFSKINKLPSVGSWMNPDYEKIIALNPDIVIRYGYGSEHIKEKLPGITVFHLEFEDLAMCTKKLGYIIDKENEAKEFIDFFEGHINIIKSRTEGLSEDEKPRVYIEMMRPYMTKHRWGFRDQCMLAGGRNIAANLPGYTVDPEWVVEQNPDIIVRISWWGKKESGYEVEDPSGIAAMREEIMNRPELVNVNAVKNERTFVFTAELWDNSPHYFVGITYWAKWFHPDLFEDLDPEAIHQEYLDRFQRIDYDLDEHGVFVYPPIEIDGGLAGIPDRYKGR